MSGVARMHLPPANPLITSGTSVLVPCGRRVRDTNVISGDLSGPLNIEAVTCGNCVRTAFYHGAWRRNH